MNAFTTTRRRSFINRLIALLLTIMLPQPALAQNDEEEVVSFSCALAIDAVLAKLDEQTDNVVVQQALEQINDDTGQLVCIPISQNEIQVRLQSTDMTPADNRLVFSLDANSYSVRKTFYGR